jgi:glycosyltransferase involved in cell wall biosynthesis
MTSMTIIPMRLGVQQRVLPSYRVPFFEMLASACIKGMSLFAGTPQYTENIDERTDLQVAQFSLARNHHILGGPFYLCWQSGFINWLEIWQPQVLIVESNPRYLRTPAAVSWMHKRDRPVICWGLGAPIKRGLFRSLRYTSWRRFVQQFDAVIAYSEQGAEEYTALGFPKERVFVAPNAVSPRPVQPLKDRPAQFSSGKPVILFVGRLQVRKRVDLLIHACAALPQGIQPRLWIVGDGASRTDLEKLARRIFPNTVFHGARYGVELDDLYKQADLFVLPGTGGLAVQQAMSYGLPVLVAEADGTQSNLVRPANGWTIPPASLDDLTGVLKTALKDPNRLRQMGKESYNIILQEINLESMVEVFARAIQAVTEG